jgi:hypothetical protein
MMVSLLLPVENCARENVSISHKDVAIVLARAILEAYGEL